MEEISTHFLLYNCTKTRNHSRSESLGKDFVFPPTRDARLSFFFFFLEKSRVNFSRTGDGREKERESLVGFLIRGGPCDNEAAAITMLPRHGSMRF